MDGTVNGTLVAPPMVAVVPVVAVPAPMPMPALGPPAAMEAALGLSMVVPNAAM